MGALRDLLSLLAHHEAVERSGFLEVGRPPSEFVETADPDAGSSQIAGGPGESHPSTVPPVASSVILTAESATGERMANPRHDRYEVLECIGGGAMGLVYRGRHLQLGMDVAIKLLKAGASAERFLREARALAQIKSPHVVRIHDFEVLPGGQPILVMEWIDGRDIRQMMRTLAGRLTNKTCSPGCGTFAPGCKRRHPRASFTAT